jgi:hypothetical protein
MGVIWGQELTTRAPVLHHLMSMNMLALPFLNQGSQLTKAGNCLIRISPGSLSLFYLLPVAHGLFRR